MKYDIQKVNANAEVYIVLKPLTPPSPSLNDWDMEGVQVIVEKGIKKEIYTEEI